MHTRGLFAPETETTVRERYEALGLPAQVVVKESARAMGFDAEEYGERVTSDVVATGRDALFASLLSVRVGTSAEFDAWREEHPGYDVSENGSPDVGQVAWHAAPFADAVVTATFENEEDAAVATVQRIAFGRLYRDAL